MNKRALIVFVRIILTMTMLFLLPMILFGNSVFATIDPNYYYVDASIDNHNPINVSPSGSDEYYANVKRHISVSTNAPSGYRLYLNTSDTENGGKLVLVDGRSSPYVSTINADLSTAAVLGSNTWGFGIPSGTSGTPPNNFSAQYQEGVSSTESNYAGIETTPLYTLIRNITSAISEEDGVDIYYGVKLSSDTLSTPGTYQADLEYNVFIDATDVVGGEATITPTSGSTVGGSSISITTSLMTDFVPSGISVTIGGQDCSNPVGSVSTGVLSVTCINQVHSSGITDVIVHIASLDIDYTIEDGFEYIETGDVKITGVSYASGTNAVSSTDTSTAPDPSVDSNGNVDFDLTFVGGLDNNTTLQAVYRLTITNSTFSDYIFTAPESNLKLRISPTEVRDIYYELSGIATGDIIPAESSVSFNVILNADYVSGEHGTEGGLEIDPVQDNTGSLIGDFVGGNTGDLSGNNTLTSFQISVQNSFNKTKNFMIESLNSDFEIVDSSGSALGIQTIAANTTGTYTFYMKKSNGVAFASETTTAGIIISYDNKYTNVGEARIAVDRDPSYIDSQAPIISNVSVVKNASVDGEATVNWSGTDNVGIANYSIYKCTTSSCDSPITEISGNINSYTFTSISDGTYYFVVVGHDDEGNTATQAEINSSNTSPGHASRTANAGLNWQYTVTGNITDGRLTPNNSTVRAGETYTGTISSTTTLGGRPPSTITITVDGTTELSPGEYEYNSSSGAVSIPNIGGNITITGEASCLIEGTMVALADGTEKAIEDITYNDLLKVWNYENGSIGAEYPAWIEKKSVATSYQLTKFSDGTELKTLGWHGVFDVDANEFISVDNETKFKPGTRVYKVENDKLVPVIVVSTEIIEEIVNYYHVVSSKYYNIIANGILTTDGTVSLSNLYGFDENIKWPETRNEIISNPNNLYTYEDFEDIGMPREMFDNLRVEEAKYLDVKYGINLDMFKFYLVNNQLNPNMWLRPNE